VWHHVTNEVDFNVEKYWELDATVTIPPSSGSNVRVGHSKFRLDALPRQGRV